MESSLTGKVALITGGSSGIGEATARALASRGARVVLASRDRARGEAARNGISDAGGEALFVPTDVRRESEVERAVDRAVQAFGGLDFIFNNAGFEGPIAPITDFDERTIDELVDTNFKGTVFGLKHGIPALLERGGGAIVNMASCIGTAVPFAPGAVYGSMKAAILSLTRSTAAGYAEHGIRVYAVCPWITDTPMIDRLTGDQEEAKQQMAAMNPSGTIASPDQTADVVISMLAGEGECESGDAVLVDSGRQLQDIRFSDPVPLNP